jgi:hypothetical protein
MNHSVPLSACLLVIANFTMASAADAQRPAIYKPQPAACYVQLRPTWPRPPYVGGENQPVCRAVLTNLNKFCHRPPQYDYRVLHSSISDLQAPPWRPLEPLVNLDLVREAFTATSIDSESKVSYWKHHEDRLLALARAGALRLKTADIDIDSDGKAESIFVLEGSYPHTAVPGSNSPIFFVAERGQRVQKKDSVSLGAAALGDLWSFKDRWYSVSFDFYKRQPGIKVARIVRYDATRIDATTHCTIQHINAYYKGS